MHYKYISTGSESYTNLEQTYSWQTGCPDKTTNENKDEEIKGMQVSINAIQLTTNVPECMTFNELMEMTSQDQQLQHLMEYMYKGTQTTKTNYHEKLEHTECSETILIE